MDLCWETQVTDTGVFPTALSFKPVCKGMDPAKRAS